ncbi:MAG: WxcM-like domain-containing protein [Chloroflexi bacterium]|nr:WxcM-like domain-containing protein [Chloroflexota bacterium]
MRTSTHPKIVTRDQDQRENGFLVPIFNVHDEWPAPEQHPKQVYLTVVSPGCVKGPHLHLERWGLFTCIKGNVKVVVRTETGYEEYLTGEDHQYATIQVPAGTPAALQNVGESDAYVLNMPAPAWRPDDQDEHPVSFDDYEFTWPTKA